MEATFKIWETNRKLYLDFFDNYSLEQLATIPTGFSNNLIWNIGHIIVVQQSLVYKLSGLPMAVNDQMVEKFKNGSKPALTTSQAEVDELKSLLTSVINKTKTDFDSGLFVNYNEFTTMSGFTISSANQALEYNNYHEAMHLGFMINIRKFI